MGKELDSDLRTWGTLGGSVKATKPRIPLSDVTHGVSRGGLREKLEAKGGRKASWKRNWRKGILGCGLE